MPELSVATPLGPLTLSEMGGAITELDWRSAGEPSGTSLLQRACLCLERYFAGRVEEFDLPLAPGGTAYERRVWAALRAIPYGTTRTYGEIARVAGGSARAVGRAVGRNPIPILIPCHRVLAMDGMGGFSAPGGVRTKRALLALEARVLGPGHSVQYELFPAGGTPDFVTSEARA
ncbi:MAG TPA: methylated-DNA--[protein]-cysteine S-methyltransferase [Acetobacteraceae bacterium]|jgi:methylated-DNA-[protein]-cysteine S-methyltransferase|nr:methylated-DNA--[protein]-cysteine S-methyltransferase [Acetobacteraceae bacterium]